MAGRRGGIAAGQSYQAVFEESYARAPIRMATAEQRSLWLLAAEQMLVKPDSSLIGSHRVAGNYSPEISFALAKDFMAPLQATQTNQASRQR